MKFQVHNLQNGSMKECDLNNLSRSLSVDSEIVLLDGEKVEAIGFVSHSLLVYFCVEFVDYSLQNYEKKKMPEAEECFSLVRKWIENPNSVSKEELEAAADAAYAAANAAYDDADDAANAAAYAAYAAANAANAADYADAAANAAADAANAAGKDREKEFERQGRFILSYFSS
jgi:hypothetical protein